MRILGLDQSSNCTGFCIIEEGKIVNHGVFDIHDIDKKHNGELYYLEKIENNLKFLERIIEEYNIDLVIIEDIQKQSNILTYKKLAWLQGNLIQLLYNKHIKFSILSPSEWRSILGIKGSRQGRKIVKENTIKYIKNNFNIDVVKDDESDAIAIAYAGYKRFIKNKLNIFERKVGE